MTEKLQPVTPVLAAELLRQAGKQMRQLLEETEALVRIESPSHDKAACDRAVTRTADWATALGGVVRRHRQRGYGDSLEVRFAGEGGKPLLLLGHLDTVWDLGTLDQMPFRVKRDRVCGPGVLDMKAGIAMALAAVRVLRACGAGQRALTLLLHCDEEIGSPASRALTERVAKRCEAVYVLEPGQGPGGAYKTARKGVGRYRLDVHGVAAHSGVDFAAGHSAVLELAHQLEQMAAMTGRAPGMTVNPGVVGGGTLSNVVAARAWAEIDVRVVKARDAERVDRLLRALKVRDKACSLAWSGGMNRPPMERTAAIGRLFAEAKKCAGALGFSLEEAATGGASDGNFTAALGVPTLDGMGASGGGAHAMTEHLLRAPLAGRVALLASLCRA